MADCMHCPHMKFKISYYIKRLSRKNVEEKFVQHRAVRTAEINESQNKNV